LDIGY
jgi:hypothetical protein